MYGIFKSDGKIYDSSSSQRRSLCDEELSVSKWIHETLVAYLIWKKALLFKQQASHVSI
jgi:hypothetical protein